MTPKDFSTIHSDYAFFEAHSTEARRDAEGYLSGLRRFDQEPTLDWLDFGCGDGAFTGKLLTMLRPSPQRLRLSLVEPDTDYRESALVHLQSFTGHTIAAWPILPEQAIRQYDLALANHVLYYVPELRLAVQQIAQSLKPTGSFFTAKSGRENDLMHLWTASFEILGKA